MEYGALGGTRDDAGKQLKCDRVKRENKGSHSNCRALTLASHGSRARLSPAAPSEARADHGGLSDPLGP